MYSTEFKISVVAVKGSRVNVRNLIFCLFIYFVASNNCKIISLVKNRTSFMMSRQNTMSLQKYIKKTYSSEFFLETSASTGFKVQNALLLILQVLNIITLFLTVIPNQKTR